MYCPNCGAKVPPGAMFCPNCGFDLRTVSSAPAPPPAPPTPAPTPTSAPPPAPPVHHPTPTPSTYQPTTQPPAPYPSAPTSTQALYGFPEAKPKREFNPTVALILSLIIPGLGQLYVEKLFRGFVFFIITVAAYLFFWPAGLLIHLYAIYDAYKLAKRTKFETTVPPMPPMPSTY